MLATFLAAWFTFPAMAYVAVLNLSTLTGEVKEDTAKVVQR